MLSGGLAIYAIIETGGKQYRVAPGQTLEVARLGVAEGARVELDRVLFVADGDAVKVGTLTVVGAKVLATAQGEGKGKKVVVFKYKPKVRYRKKTGHRQLYTRLSIDKIIGLGEAGAAEPARKTSRRKKVEGTEGGA